MESLETVDFPGLRRAIEAQLREQGWGGIRAEAGADRLVAVARRPPPILVVDGDPDERAVTAALLDDAGYRVTADAPGGALDLARRERPALAVLDVLMPGLDGASLCRRLRERYGRDLPVVFHSEVPENVVASLAAACEPWGYLPKPCTAAALLAAVHRHLPAA